MVFSRAAVSWRCWAASSCCCAGHAGFAGNRPCSAGARTRASPSLDALIFRPARRRGGWTTRSCDREGTVRRSRWMPRAGHAGIAGTGPIGAKPGCGRREGGTRAARRRAGRALRCRPGRVACCPMSRWARSAEAFCLVSLRSGQSLARTRRPARPLLRLLIPVAPGRPGSLASTREWRGRLPQRGLRRAQPASETVRPDLPSSPANLTGSPHAWSRATPCASR
jgi:hypothetical protein